MATAQRDRARRIRSRSAAAFIEAATFADATG